MDNEKILLLEDDTAIAMGLVYSLEKENYIVSHAQTVKEAKELLDGNSFSLCILDINLPDGNGYEVCKYIKEKEDTPVLFLTAYDDEVNVIMGLELGADDYICKPFRVRELMARIKTVLRRSGRAKTAGGSSNEAEYTVIENICIYPKEAKIYKLKEKISGKPVISKENEIELTAMEYRLLLIFLNNRGIVMSRAKLLECMWDVSGDFVNDNTLTVYIKRLRDKIEDDPTNPIIIKTVRGIGYMIDKEI
ncbi:MAG: response regulator transcription factor [Lachnospiraceae bacterium]|nr:response regulator transcription factor [Lachnospiraceae bacterium]